jgi:hypothetical protein
MSRKRKLDDLLEAITFAEVGELDTASGIAKELFREQTAPEAQRILAVSRTSAFSRRLVEQSLAMAERMGYGVVALSVVPAVARLMARLRGGRLPRGHALPPELFRERAAERGVPFVHAVGKGDPERAVVAVTRRFRRIAFLLVEPDVAPRARFAGVPVPVFFLDEG